MATQVLYAEEVGKELKFGNLNDSINLTDFLDEQVGDLFKEKHYYEDEDEISYRIVSYTDIIKLVDSISSAEAKLFDELKEVRGNEKKSELISKLKDLSLLEKVIFKALLQKSENSVKVIALL